MATAAYVKPAVIQKRYPLMLQADELGKKSILSPFRMKCYCKKVLI
jgi:hypothetical protein